MPGGCVVWCGAFVSFVSSQGHPPCRLCQVLGSATAEGSKLPPDPTRPWKSGTCLAGTSCARRMGQVTKPDQALPASGEMKEQENLKDAATSDEASSATAMQASSEPNCICLTKKEAVVVCFSFPKLEPYLTFPASTPYISLCRCSLRNSVQPGPIQTLVVFT